MRDLTLASSSQSSHDTVVQLKKRLEHALNEQISTRAAAARVSIDRARELPTVFLTQLIKDNQRNDTIKQIKTPTATHTSNADIIVEFHRYYTLLYSSNAIASTPLEAHIDPFPQGLINLLSSPPTPQDVLIPIMRKRRKSPGPDGIPMEVYIFCPVALLLLTKVISHVWRTGLFPDSWLLSFTKMIPKEGKDPAIVGNYRGIALCNTDYKAFAAYPAALIQAHYNFPRNQTGAIRGRSTADAIMRVSNYLQLHDDALPIFIDFEKAYDKVNRQWLKIVLRSVGLPKPLMDAIINIQINSKTRLIINRELSPDINKEGGIGQGDPLSSLLFNLCIQPLLNYLSSHDIFCHGHVDDIITAPSQQLQVDTLLEALRLYEIQTGGKFNGSKTIVISRPDTDLRFPFSVTDIPQRYLGISLSADGHTSPTQESTKSILTTLSAATRLHLSLAGKLSVLQSYTHPIFLYAATLSTVDTTKEITNIENWFLTTASASTPYNPTHTYPSFCSKPKQDHPLSRFCCPSLPLSLKYRQANLLIKISTDPITNRVNLPPTALTNIPLPGDSVYTIITNAWKSLLPNLHFVSKRVTSQDIENARGKFIHILKNPNKNHPILTTKRSPKQQHETITRQNPIPLSKGQLAIVNKFNTNFHDLYPAISSPLLRSQITSFLWTLISRKTWLDKPHTHHCPFCNSEPATTPHIFLMCPSTPNHTPNHTSTLLTPPHSPKKIILPALKLWCIWKVTNTHILDTQTVQPHPHTLYKTFLQSEKDRFLKKNPNFEMRK
jgi:hypothetical protein